MNEEETNLVDYLRRAYHAVDGLWFMMVEEAEGFEQALELDKRVWRVLAKINARKARELLGCSGNTLDELARCFGLKLTADGHRFESTITPDAVRFLINGCPWLDLLHKSNRQAHAAKIAQAICLTEGAVWCGEFGGEYVFTMPAMACEGGDCCEMLFTRKLSSPNPCLLRRLSDLSS